MSHQFNQSSSTRPGTLANSLVLLVTRTALATIACPAIAVSIGPNGVPAVASAALICVVKSTAARFHGRMASRRALKALISRACRGEGFLPDGTQDDVIPVPHDLQLVDTREIQTAR